MYVWFQVKQKTGPICGAGKWPFEGKSNTCIKCSIALPIPFMHQVAISVAYSDITPTILHR